MAEKILDPATEQEQMLVAEYTDLKTQIAAIDAEDIAAMNPGEKKYYENKLARKAFLASRLKMHGLLFEVEDEEETLAAPTISPAPTQGGEETSSLEVMLSHEDEDATIYYTTNGETPTAESMEYEDAFTISNAESESAQVTVKAIAVKDGESSEVASATYTLAAVEPVAPAAPTISPAPTQGGEESSSLSVTLSHEDEEASIYYTTDGETPTSESTLYDTSFSIANTDAEAKQVTVKAIAVKDGESSEVASATYTLAAVEPVAPAAPTISPTPAAEAEEEQQLSVSISHEDENVTIYYTTNGETPTVESEEYGTSILVANESPDGSQVTVKAIAVKNGVSSEVASATYSFPAPPSVVN